MKLAYSEDYSYSALAEPRTNIYGLVEFLSRTPNYTNEMYKLYKYAKVMAVEIQFTVVNQSLGPLLMAVAPFAHEDLSTTIDPQFVQERQRSVSRVVGSSNGVDKAVIRKTYYTFDEIGQPLYDQKFWIDKNQSNSTTPVDGNTPAIAISLSSLLTGNTWSATSNVRYTYHIEWFSPKIGT
jgi:hypothetical protein